MGSKTRKVEERYRKEMMRKEKEHDKKKRSPGTFYSAVDRDKTAEAN